MTEPNDLLAAVDALTKPITNHFTQTTDAGTIVKIHSAQNPPLLEQLYAAVAPGSESVAGSTSLASTRNLIDSDALFEHAKMTSQIGDWCRMVKVRPTRNPVNDLRAWYVAYHATDSDEDWYRRQLRTWAHIIGEILDKPKRFEVAFCPVCKSRTWINQDGDELTYPIIVEYKVPKDGSRIEPRAHCRVKDCGTVWDSFAAIEELGEELAEV